MSIDRIKELEKIVEAPVDHVIEVKPSGHVVTLNSFQKTLKSIFRPGTFENCHMKVIATRIINLIPHGIFYAILYDTNTPYLLIKLEQRLNLIHPKKTENQKALEGLLDYIRRNITSLSRFIMTRDFCYDQKALHAAYLLKHAANPLKTIPLQVVKVETTAGLKRVFNLLNDWMLLSAQHQSLCLTNKLRAAYLNEKPLKWELLESSFKRNISVIKGSSWFKLSQDKRIKGVLPGNFTVSVAMNQNGQIFGISITHPEKDRPSIPYIELLASNPNNLLNPVLAGVSTALIEGALIQSLHAQGLYPHGICSTLMKRTMISLYSLSGSDQFYRHLGFQKHALYDSKSSEILTGDGIIHFLENFGGRGKA